MKKKIEASDMLAFLNVDEMNVDTRVQRVKKIRNATDILNAISLI
jgi:hypothetical protein